MFYYNFFVRKHERGLLFKDGDFLAFLEPGRYRYLDLNARYRAEVFDVGSEPAFEHRLANYLVQHQRAKVDALLEVVETGANETAIVYFDEQPAAVIGPAERRLYWKDVVALRVERFDLAEGPQLDERVTRRLLGARSAGLLATPAGKGGAGAAGALMLNVVSAGHTGLLYVDGELVSTLPPGPHAFWRVDRTLRVEEVDARVKPLEVTGQEILTRDKVSVRINVTASYRVEEPLVAFRAVKDPLDYLYKEIQFALRSIVGTRTLDALLEDKEAINSAVADALKQRFADLGINVLGVGVKDIILPGDMKELLGKVVEADKVAQANVIRRREETNATRSLLNTAKVMESNAVALRLKELETLEKLTEKIGTLSVYSGNGGLDALVSDLVRLNR